ncbi:MAG: hypothetical protein R3D68_19560 [Hyphomicrobiaceae bacterium]
MQRPAWTRFFKVTELLIIDLLLGIVAMVALFIFGTIAEWLHVDTKEIVWGVTFAHLFRIGHAMNIIVVLGYSIWHVIEAYRASHER